MKKTTHVIEYSAYEELKKENKKLLEHFDYQAEINMLKRENKELEHELQMERDGK